MTLYDTPGGALYSLTLIYRQAAPGHKKPLQGTTSHGRGVEADFYELYILLA